MRKARFSFAIEPVERVYHGKPGWQALAAAAIEPNPHYEPEFLMASARHLGRAGRMRVALLRDGLRESRPVALFPLQSPRLREGILFGAASLYASPYVTLTAPLLDRDTAAEALGATLDALAARPDMPDVLHFPILAERRGFAALLQRHAQQSGRALFVLDRHERAAIDPRSDISPANRRPGKATNRKLDQKARRLGAAGAVAYDVIGPSDPGAPQALADFLAIEASGWKGRRGTALASRQATRAFAEAAFVGPMPAVLFERLSLDGRPIAMNLNLVSGGVSYTAKTAYDEAFAAFSPGMLLDRFALERVLGDPATIRADSCARPDHAMGALWREREPIISLLLALRPGTPETVFVPIAARMALASRLRNALRGLREWLAPA